MKWWLISDKDVRKLERELSAGWCYDALDTLDTALHKTDAIPDDYKMDPTDE